MLRGSIKEWNDGSARTRTVVTIALVIFFAGVSCASAQEISVGGRIGTDWSSSVHDPELAGAGFASHVGFAGGIQADVWFDDMWAISVQALYDQKGYKVVSPFTASDVYTYLEIPILAKVGIGSTLAKFYMEAGPSIGYKLAVKTERYGVTNLDSTIKSTDISFYLGGGIQYRLSEDAFLVSDIGYAFGLSNISTEAIGKITLSNIRFGLGAMFPL